MPAIKKSDLRSAILAIEPTNVVAVDARSTHEGLSKEYAEAKRRKATREGRAEKSVTVNFREEVDCDVKFSWKLCVVNDDGIPIPVTDLRFGNEIPIDGVRSSSDDDGTPLKVDGNIDDLEIEAGDLIVRERFDPRRVYETANGSKTVFKRVENGRVILWSYKHGGEIGVKPSLSMKRTVDSTQRAASDNKRMTQKIVASYLIAKNPNISGVELTAALRDAFPQARVDNRHGPHYLSLSRNGRLPEPPDTDPRNW